MCVRACTIHNQSTNWRPNPDDTSAGSLGQLNFKLGKWTRTTDQPCHKQVYRFTQGLDSTAQFVGSRPTTIYILESYYRAILRYMLDRPWPNVTLFPPALDSSSAYSCAIEMFCTLLRLAVIVRQDEPARIKTTGLQDPWLVEQL